MSIVGTRGFVSWLAGATVTTYFTPRFVSYVGFTDTITKIFKKVNEDKPKEFVLLTAAQLTALAVSEAMPATVLGSCQRAIAGSLLKDYTRLKYPRNEYLIAASDVFKGTSTMIGVEVAIRHLVNYHDPVGIPVVEAVALGIFTSAVMLRLLD